MASELQPFGEESSSSDSSEESSSEDEQQLQQHSDKQEQSSSSESEGEDESGSGMGQDEEVPGHDAALVSEDDNYGQHATNRMASADTQDLFGGESSSGSSSGSGSEGGPCSTEDIGSPSGSRTSEPPSTSPLGVIPPEGGQRDSKGRNSQTLEGIFGDAADLSSSDDEGETATPPRRIVREEVDFGDMSDDCGAEGVADVEARIEEEAPVEEEAPRINVDIPRCVAELGTDIHFVKLPNFLSVEPRPFDPNLYEDEGEDDDVLDEEGRARLKLKVENTIRWRYTQDEEGNEVRESNTRVVRWSDGTLSLFLGSEIFDITKQPLQGEYSHLFVRQGTGLQGQAVFKNKITFRPHSTDSQTHRKMTLSIADRFSKAQKIRVLPVAGKDPESQRSERIKKAEETLRAAVRSDNQKRRMKERNTRKGGITASDLEPDRDLDLEEDIGAIKSSFRSRMGTRRRDHEDSDESSEEEEEAHERLMRAKVNIEESPTSKRQTRGGNASIRGGGDKDKGRRGVHSRKLLSSSDDDSD